MIFISFKTKTLNELTLKTKFSKKNFFNTHKSNKLHKPNIKHGTQNTNINLIKITKLIKKGGPRENLKI